MLPIHEFLLEIGEKTNIRYIQPLPGVIAASPQHRGIDSRTRNYEVLRLNRHWLCVEFVFPHESAVVSKARS